MIGCRELNAVGVFVLLAVVSTVLIIMNVRHTFPQKQNDDEYANEPYSEPLI